MSTETTTTTPIAPSKKSGKKATKTTKTTDSKATSKTTKVVRAKATRLAGQKLVKTAKGNDARRDATRRTSSWNAFKSGMTYEAAMKAGAMPADIAKMIVMGHVVAQQTTAKAPKAAKPSKAGKEAMTA